QGAALNQLAQRLAQAASSASASTLNALVASARAALGGGMGNASAQGSGQGSGNAAGGGAGLGGQGQQGFGSGAGMGHTTRDAGYAEGSARRTGTGGAGAPVDKTGVYQSIYDPTRLGDGGEISQSTGGVGEGDVARADLAPGLGQAGDAVPYAQNAYQYARSAANAAGAPGVPDDVRDRVNRYFDALIDESEG
ncbi:MAG: hypothetical protein GX558_08225, partial [Clostridiales bacterium]|nr:hypothetical protein [Clostridiales bacterium]